MRKCMIVRGVGMMLNRHESAQKEITVFQVIVRLLPMIFYALPVLFIVCVILGLFHGTSIGFSTFVFQHFFDSVTQFIAEQATLTYVILMGIGLGAVIIGTDILNGVHNFIAKVFVNKMIGVLGKEINRKSARIDPIAYETPALLNDINKADEGMGNSIWMILIMFTVITFYVPYFLFMAVYLYYVKPILVIALVLIFIPVAMNQVIRSVVFAKLEDQSAPIRRQFDYYEQCLTAREYFKETRILGAFHFFRTLFLDALQLLGKKIWQAEFKVGMLELGMKMLTLAGYFGVLYLLFTSTLNGDISIGAFAAVFASIGMMFQVMEEVVTQQIGNMSRNLGTVRNFIRFLDLPERKGLEDVELSDEGIKLEDVYFKYPEASNDAIKGVTLDIKKGETIAIVGGNGSGKTTLVKLLTGIYVPNRGHVFIGGVNTKDASSTKLYQDTSAVFQNYQRYKMSLKDNVSISHDHDDEADLDTAAHKAEVDVLHRSFPDGWNTMLSREFDGVDLSGGQWQRVAIARGFFRPHELIVLDEPTAAIDPIEETKLYEKFAEATHGKTSLVITHRLGSARIADRIVVMDQGQIVEMGTHSELLNKGGHYARMFAAQAQWYVAPSTR